MTKFQILLNLKSLSIKRWQLFYQECMNFKNPCESRIYSASILDDFTTCAQFAYSVLTMAPSCCGFI